MSREKTAVNVNRSRQTGGPLAERKEQKFNRAPDFGKKADEGSSFTGAEIPEILKRFPQPVGDDIDLTEATVLPTLPRVHPEVHALVFACFKRIATEPHAIRSALLSFLKRLDGKDPEAIKLATTLIVHMQHAPRL